MLARGIQTAQSESTLCPPGQSVLGARNVEERGSVPPEWTGEVRAAAPRVLLVMRFNELSCPDAPYLPTLVKHFKLCCPVLSFRVAELPETVGLVRPRAFHSVYVAASRHCA